jgi:hypothetical protein
VQRGFGSSVVCDGVRCRRDRSLSRPRPSSPLFCPYGVPTPIRCGGDALWVSASGGAARVRWCGRIVCVGVGDLWGSPSNDLGFHASIN